MTDIVNIVNNLSEQTLGISIILNTPEVLNIVQQDTTSIINIVDSSGIAGPGGEDGQDGQDGIDGVDGQDGEGAVPPSTADIHFTDNKISSVSYENGREVIITYDGDDIISTYDGTYTKTFIRDINNNIIRIVVE